MQGIVLRHTTTKSLVTGRYVKPLLLVFLFLVSLAWSAPCLAESSSELLIRGRNALSVGDIRTATDLLHQVPAPGSFAQSRMLLARMFFSIKDYDNAGGACQEVLAVYPDNPEALNFLAAIDQVNRPAYVQFFLDTVKFFPALAKGTVMTLLLVVLTILISPIGGLLIALGRISSFKPLNVLC